MSTRRKQLLLIFVMGIVASTVILPLTSALGVPSFNVLLVALFGEGSIWAIAFSLLLILLILVGVNKMMKNYA